jgi:dihydroxy-acid dehydratase
MSAPKAKLRSAAWFGTADKNGFMYRSWMKNQGIPDHEFAGKPIIGICNTWSELTPCNSHFRKLAEHVKRGVYEAGGFPVEFPVFSNGESNLRPTAMFTRNLASMDVEEAIRGNPIDAVVLMVGCDKTTPALLMGAASAGLPALFVPAGPMLRGHHRGKTLGSGTDLFGYFDEYRAGRVGECEMAEVECGLARSPGHCMTMGTASTMTACAEALGMSLPGASSIPAVDSAHYRMAAASGMRAVAIAREGLTPQQVMTYEAFQDAAATVLTLSGSTNALIHLVAMAGRLGVDLRLDDFDAIGERVPVLADVRPVGRFLMEDFYYAGGLRALFRQLAEVPGALHPDRPTVAGVPFGQYYAEGQTHDPEVIRTPANPVAEHGGVAVLRGNLAPDGAVIKHLAAEPRLLTHTGPAVVFDSYPDLQARIDDPELGITEDTVLVLRGAGPLGGPGMPEYGMLPIPAHLLKKGVTDLVRISDARMSGTSYGTCVLHVAPESTAGGPLALVRTGDLITLDVPARTLRLEVDDAELARRRAAWTPPAPRFERGYGALYAEHITQANQGCDFDFLARPGVNPAPDPH